MTHLRLALFLIGFSLAAGASAAHAESGIASVYSGGDTASGEQQNPTAFTALFIGIAILIAAGTVASLISFT